MIDASSSELESKYHLALAELVVVPHAARGKSVSVSEAATWLGCRSSLILDLIERGLPVVAYNNGSPMLELVDIANLGLIAATGKSVSETAEAHLLRYAAREDRNYLEAQRWSLTSEYKCSCDDSAPWFVNTPAEDDFCNVGMFRQMLEGRAIRITVEFESRGQEVKVLPSPIAQIYVNMIDVLATGVLKYQWLTESLRSNPSLCAQLGVADCLVTSQLLVSSLETAGFSARTRCVTALGPASVDHVWAEVLDESGTWVVLDPVFGIIGARIRKEDPRVSPFTKKCAGLRTNRVLPWSYCHENVVAYHQCTRPRPTANIVAKRLDI